MNKAVLIIPLEDIDKDIILKVKNGLLRHNFPAEVGERMKIPKNAYNEKRDQYLASDIIELGKVIDAEKLLFITDKDIYADHLNYIFGQAEIGGKCALISVYRLSWCRCG